MTRPDPRIEQSRTLVLDAAVALFLERGLAAVTMEGTATRSGVSRSTLYRHWPNRDALTADMFASFDFRIELPPRQLPTEERFRLVTRQLAEVLTDERWRRLQPVILDALLHHRNELLMTVARTQHAQQKVVSAILTDAIADGDLPPDTDRREVMLQLLGPLTMAATFDPAGVTPQLADRVVELFFASRRPTKQPRSRRTAP